MSVEEPDFDLRLARDENDLIAAQRLRYDVFVDELGGGGVLVDHHARLERDRYDRFYDHLLLMDRAAPGTPVVGVYRLLRDDQAARAGRYYTEDEYDLSVLKASGRRLLELGRSCVHRDYRGGTAMLELWNGLADYVARHRIDILFGVASFHGTDVRALAQPLALLRARYLAPPDLRVRAVDGHYQCMDLMPERDIDRVAAMKATPALIKAYLRLGGFVGDGAFVDHAFNTVDVCLIMDTATMSTRHRVPYARGPA